MTYYSPWKAARHPDRLAKIKAGEPVAPTNIQVDIEGWCPHSCQFCTYRNVGWQAKGMTFDPPERRGEASGLPREIALDLPDQMVELGTKAIEITGGGESLVSPYIGEFLEALSHRNIQTALITNGAALNAERRRQLAGAAWVRVSLDAATPDTHSRVHGVPPSAFNHILSNVREFAAVRRPGCKLGASFVITPDNAAEIVGAAQLYRDLGFDNVRYAVTYEPTGTGWLTPDLVTQVTRDLARVQRDSSERFRVFGATYRLDYYSRPNTDFHTCHSQRFVWAIGTDCKVYPCCIMKYHQGFEMGDLQHESLGMIAKRQAQTIGTFDVQRCKPCWLRDKSQLVSYLLESEPEHVEYV